MSKQAIDTNKIVQSKVVQVMGNYYENQDMDFQWQKLADEMRALVRMPVAGSETCRLEDLFVFQEGEYKRQGDDMWINVGSLDAYFGGIDFDRLKQSLKPLLIFGDFGVGKSSFLKMTASMLLEKKGRFFPIFIPLKELGLYDLENLHQSVVRFLDVYGHFDLNRLQRDVIFLFDGFDELNFYRDKEEWIRTCYSQLTALMRYPHVHVVISSRPLLFLKDDANISEGTPILRVNGFDDKRMRKWLKRWKNINRKKTSISFGDLLKRGLLETLRTPLLLYMAAQIYDEELQVERVYSRGLIFKLFYDWTIRGKYRADSQAHRIPANYREILQNIALAIATYRDYDGFIAFEQLEKSIKEYQDESLDKELFRVDRIVLVGHFFKMGERDKLTYVEFTHKSFHEYLVAEKLFRFFQQVMENKKVDYLAWVIFGRMPVQREVMRFLGDLLATLPEKELMELYLKLNGLMLLLIQCGQFKNIWENNRFTNGNELNTFFYRSLNLSATSFIASCILASHLDINPGDYKDKYHAAYIGYIYTVCHTSPTTLSFTRKGIDKDYSYRKAWATIKQFLGGSSFENLTLDGLSFIEASLENVSFAAASICRCDFSSARFKNNNFQNSRCESVDFSDAVIEGGIFDGTVLDGSIFRKCKIKKSRFTGMSFRRVDFSDAVLEECEFLDCTFQHVDFSGLSVVDCSGLPAELSADVNIKDKQ